jgi:GNAT superfamily N-acetyltransferase
VRPADHSDLPTLVEFMREFYAESGFPLDAARAGAAFAALLDEPRLGRVWLVQRGDAIAGYVAVTFVFAMEYGGMIGVIDDFYVRPAYRGRGLGTAALTQVRAVCEQLGLRALHVEVGRENAAAQAVYRHTGLGAVDHQLMSLRLGLPLHEGRGAIAAADDRPQEGGRDG